MTNPTGDNSLNDDANIADIHRDYRETEEQDAFEVERRQRTIADLASRLLQRQETIGIEAGRRRFSGSLTSVGNDFLTLRASGASVHIPFGTVAWLRGSGTAARPKHEAGKDAPTETPRTFRARLHHLRSQRSPVEIGAIGAVDPINGRISVLASDHIILQTPTGDCAVPLPAIAFVAVRDELAPED